jgi:16S rRNA G966 N2-methylase RsmD
LNRINELKDYKFDLIKSKNPKVIAMVNIEFESRDEKYLRITDYFSEDVRIKCNFKGYISPYNYYNLNKEVIGNSLKPDADYKEIDRYLHKNGPNKNCSNFNLIVSLFVLNYFKPKKWLDPSAGWGDRLISAIIYGKCTYTGIDPNEKMHPKYKEIIETLSEVNEKDEVREGRLKYQVIQGGFEDVDIEANYYDLIFTSPPFFDLESYSKDNSQSNVKFNTLEKWKNGFLYPFLIKATRALEKDGHLCLYVNNYDGVKYVGDIHKYLQANKKMQQVGSLSWQDSSYPRNILVYKKILK